ncbi:LacI family DNA-binding transcriptional regulator [Amphritea sp. 1_MG-2023]|uniref:LacI family DNA-binding transcriptional regulator n=1 Tax=Amphritea sp. 1_MG-2023 TaxID=3062670 RepID=UPI0026E31C2C|nr:LacI family DNA-binding transcriptional regulator [Amphritea sp. 1_MG-2023]MDO6565253.1 LacI family DNA-binding transcriptional regulator [Amphritea sp. 1_MG-2023]
MKATDINLSKSATMGDVARAAGVAPATVSRYLNNPDVVSPKTKHKIDQAIRAMNYVPHAAARTLASKKSRMIGAIVPSLDSNLFAPALEAFQSQVSKAGYTLVVASDNYDAEQEFKHINQMVSHGIDALLLVGSSHDEAIYQLLKAKQIPYVLTWTTTPQEEHPCIGFNNKIAAANVANYLMDLGHTKFAMISNNIKRNDRAHKRLLGVRDALALRGLSMSDEYLVERPISAEQGREAFRLLMSRSEPPTAIICGSEPFAYGAIFESKHLGLEVPRDVSITGFDDMWLASLITPSLTTVRTPQQKVGALAADYLIAKLTGKDVALPTPLEVEIIVRESCAPPSKH